jgi:transposase InsO family protein
MVSPFSKFLALTYERTFTDGCHKRLGHPSHKIVAQLVKNFFLLVSSSKLYSLCNFCSINKAHQLPFHQNSLTSQAPLDLNYTDVWGPASSTSIDGSHYYVIFVDHFSKYIWFYPMVKKFDVSIIFPHFKKFIETQLQTKIKSLYSDNGGEFITLRSIFLTSEISYYTIAHYTPQQNGVTERRYRHLVETSLTLLHDAKLDHSY